jgi:hypothetical protein
MNKRTKKKPSGVHPDTQGPLVQNVVDKDYEIAKIKNAGVKNATGLLKMENISNLIGRYNNNSEPDKPVTTILGGKKT